MTMLKRFAVLLLALSLLLGCVLPAGATGLTKATRYDMALQEVRKYLDGDDAVPLDTLCELLGGLAGYKQSAEFYSYVCILRDVEKGEFGRVYDWIGRLQNNPDFCAYLTENGYNSVEELQSYAHGREAEEKGEVGDAIAWYRQCQSMPGVYWRISQLEDAELERRYQRACELLEQNTAESCGQAYEIFAELAKTPYMDSAFLAEEAAAREAEAAAMAEAAAEAAYEEATVEEVAAWEAEEAAVEEAAVEEVAAWEAEEAVVEEAAVEEVVAEEAPVEETVERIFRSSTVVGSYCIDLYADGTCTITAYRGSEYNVTIPDRLDGYSVTEIGERAFYDNDLLTSVVFPDAVTEIGAYAFYHCGGLEQVKLPSGLRVIQESAFGGCPLQGKLTLPSGLRTICENAFIWTNLTEVFISAKVRTIEAGAFAACEQLTTITVDPANKWFEVRENALIERKGTLCLYPGGRPERSYTIPSGVTRIGEQAFFRCANLEYVEIPYGVTEIDDTGFVQCHSLIGITLPESLQRIGYGAFYYCTSLEKIRIPAGVREIGETAFQDCCALRQIVIAEGNPYYRVEDFSLISSDGVLIAYLISRTDTHYWVPEGVKRIGEAAFMPEYQNSKMIYVHLPYGLTEIGARAFQGTDTLEKVVIPETVTEIGDFAFSECSKVTLAVTRGSCAVRYAVDNGIRYTFERD